MEILMLCRFWAAARHEQAKLIGAGGVERRRGFRLVDRGQLIVARPTAVLDFHREPPPTVSPWMVTGVLGGENMVAFSASSAIRWMTSPTTGLTSAALVPRWP
jgi:hypothetical protein